MDSSSKSQLCVGCCIISVATLVILIIVSFSSLSMNEYGLDYSGISKQINPSPFQAGIYFLGISHHFIKFPKTVITIDFSNDPGADSKPLATRSSDGLEVLLSLSFQFKVKYEELFKIYQKFQDKYRIIFELIAQDVLSSLATQYSAYNFFIDRTTIGTAMQSKLNEVFQAECFSTIEFFQLKVVDLPDKFEESIQDSEVKKQGIQQAYATKNKAIIELETLVMSAEYQKNVTINMALGDSKQIMFTAEAESSSLKIRQLANSQCYSQLKKTLGMQSKELINYIRTKVVRMYDGDTLLISMKEISPVGTTSSTTKQLRKSDYEDSEERYSIPSYDDEVEGEGDQYGEVQLDYAKIEKTVHNVTRENTGSHKLKKKKAFVKSAAKKSARNIRSNKERDDVL